MAAAATVAVVIIAVVLIFVVGLVLGMRLAKVKMMKEEESSYLENESLVHHG